MLAVIPLLAVLFLGANAAPISLSNPYGAFNKAFNATCSVYWNYGQQSWSEKGCPGAAYASPVLWNLAVAGGMALNTANPYYAPIILQQLSKYRNAATGGYLSTTNGDEDMYTDDNAQVVWVYIDAYKLSGDPSYLELAENIMSWIKSQWNSNGGGVRWNYNGDYLASISQTESALAAVKLYEVTHDDTYLKFSKQCINWCFDNLQDPSDHLFYDGKTISTGNINKGKLAYTVGTAISTLSHLYTIDHDSQWLDRATELVRASASGSGALYNSKGQWNNPLKYLYLLFAGLADFTTKVTPNSLEGWKLKQSIASEVSQQANLIFQYYQDSNTAFYYDDMSDAPASVVAKYNLGLSVKASLSSSSLSSEDPSTCPDGQNVSTLLTNAAAARCFYEAWRT